MGTDCNLILKKKDGTTEVISLDRFWVFSQCGKLEHRTWYSIDSFIEMLNNNESFTLLWDYIENEDWETISYARYWVGVALFEIIKSYRSIEYATILDEHDTYDLEDLQKTFKIK